MSQNTKWMSLFLKDSKNLAASAVKARERVSTSSPSLNWALSGGFYYGYSTCLYGPEGSGKSLVSMIAVGSMMQADPNAWAVLVTTEHRPPTPERLRLLGVDPERLMIRQANTLHDVFDWITSKDDKFTNSDGSKGGAGLSYALENGFPCKALIIDSIKGIQGPKEQNIETVEKDFMGDISKFLNPSLRSILPIIRQYEMMTILVQQVNMQMDPNEVAKGKKWVIPSGQSLKHFCETMALVERVDSKATKLYDEDIQSIRELPVQIGHTIRVRVEKANLDSPFREAEFQIHYKKGVVNTALEVAKLGANLGVITHPLNPETGKEIAAHWTVGDQRFIGFDNMVKAIDEDSDLERKIMNGIRELDKV